MNKNRLGIVLAVVGSITLIAALYFGFLFIFGDIAEKPDYLFEQFAAGEYKEAYDSTSDLFKESIEYEDFVVAGEYWNIDEVVDTKWNSRGFRNDYGHVSGELVYADGSTIDAHLDLVQSDDEWLVTAVAFGEAARLKAEEASVYVSDGVLPESEDLYLQQVDGVELPTVDEDGFVELESEEDNSASQDEVVDLESVEVSDEAEEDLPTEVVE